MRVDKAFVIFGDTPQVARVAGAVIHEFVSELSDFFDVSIISIGDLRSSQATPTSFLKHSRVLIESGPEPFRQSKSLLVRVIGLALSWLEVRRVGRSLSKLVGFEKPALVFVFIDFSSVAQIAQKVNFGNSQKVAVLLGSSAQTDEPSCRACSDQKPIMSIREFVNWKHIICLVRTCDGSAAFGGGASRPIKKIRSRTLQTVASEFDMNWLSISPSKLIGSGDAILSWLGIRPIKKIQEDLDEEALVHAARNRMGTWSNSDIPEAIILEQSEPTLILNRGHAIRVWSAIFSAPTRRVGFFSVLLSLALRGVNFLNQEIIKLFIKKR